MSVSSSPDNEPAAPPRKRRKNSSREQLLQAASELLKSRHTTDVSFSEIAQLSGLNSALIKYHFGHKDGLLMALVERDAAKTMTTMTQLIAMDIPPVEKMRLHISGVINTYAKYPYLNKLIHTLMDSKSSRVSQTMVASFVKPLMDAETQILREGIESGDFREVDSTLFYYAVVGACDYIFYARHSRKWLPGVGTLTPAVRDNYVEFVADMVLRMLKPD